MPMRSGFAPCDGTSLYYSVTGPPSPVTLVCCNGVGVSTFFWKYIVEHFRSTHQMLLWDYRGTVGPAAPTTSSTPTSPSDETLKISASCSKPQRSTRQSCC